MNDYIVRKSELYNRARQALSRVQGHYDGRRQGRQGSTWSTRSNWSSSWDGWYQGHWRRDEDLPPLEPNEPRGRANESQEGTSNHDRDESYESAQEEPWSQRPSRYASSGWDPSYEDEEWVNTSKELLPDFLQGWYLLMDSGLDGHERNMIQTAVRGDFSLHKIAHELRAQWPEDELRRRDQQHRQAGYWNEDDEDEELYGNQERENAMTAVGLMGEGMNDEGIALIGEAEEEVQEALNVMHQARRTLREARSKQHQVKMNRQYYQTTTVTRPKNFDRSQGKGIQCFKCGGPHKIAQCPDRNAPTSSTTKVANVATEEAPFICFEEQEEICLGAVATSSRMTTEEAIQQGYGVIDGGATKTLGSVHALEAIQNRNLEKYQDARILNIDTNNTPSFGFGNSSKDRCCSTATLQITANDRPGQLQVHALDRGTGPLLLSVETLRRLGAVIDFEEDLVVFRKINDQKAIQAARSQAGHQLLPISDDLYKDALDCDKPVPSLRSFCRTM